jgi:biotin synthase-related radical SAM superfamily protein
MPLASVNYSGGIIITDWYTNERIQNESIKITIRFLTNEIRSDALNITIFTRKCKESLINCKYIQSNKSLVAELKKEILRRATKFQIEDKEKKKKKK